MQVVWIHCSGAGRWREVNLLSWQLLMELMEQPTEEELWEMFFLPHCTRAKQCEWL